MIPSKKIKYALMGFVLSLGAPLGFIVYDYFFINEAYWQLPQHVDHLYDAHLLTMLYLTLPTMVVFVCFGFFLGNRQDLIQYHRDEMDLFSQVLSHDIRSPLNIIKQAASMIEMGDQAKNLNALQLKGLKIIDRQIQLIIEMVSQLLDISRLEAKKFAFDFQQVDLEKIILLSIEETEELFSDKQVRVHVLNQAQDPLCIQGDSFRLRQVFRNLLSNAARYVPIKGRVEFGIKRLGSHQIEVTCFNEGASIPDDFLPHIFNRFAQARRRENKLGMGLGLAICKDIVEEHKGSIFVTNVEDGVMFVMRFFEGENQR